MDAEKLTTQGRNKVSIRVLIPRADYRELKKIGEMERTDFSTLIRRATAHHFLYPAMIIRLSTRGDGIIPFGNKLWRHAKQIL